MLPQCASSSPLSHSIARSQSVAHVVVPPHIIWSTEHCGAVMIKNDKYKIFTSLLQFFRWTNMLWLFTMSTNDMQLTHENEITDMRIHSVTRRFSRERRVFQFTLFQWWSKPHCKSQIWTKYILIGKSVILFLCLIVKKVVFKVTVDAVGLNAL